VKSLNRWQQLTDGGVKETLKQKGRNHLVNAYELSADSEEPSGGNAAEEKKVILLN